MNSSFKQKTFASLSVTALLALPTIARAAEETHGGGSVLDDINLWVTLSFLIVVGLIVYMGVPGKLAAFFSTRADEVRSTLDDARLIREDAQSILADYQKRQSEVEDESAGILEQAKEDAKHMASEAHAKLEEQLTRRKKAAEDRITRAEAQAIAQMRNQAADMAIAAAQKIITGRVDDRAQDALIDKAIADVSGRLN